MQGDPGLLPFDKQRASSSALAHHSVTVKMMACVTQQPRIKSARSSLLLSSPPSPSTCLLVIFLSSHYFFCLGLCFPKSSDLCVFQCTNHKAHLSACTLTNTFFLKSPSWWVFPLTLVMSELNATPIDNCNPQLKFSSSVNGNLCLVDAFRKTSHFSPFMLLQGHHYREFLAL